nr:IclR family transcriptional regulator C-terminal domain-containing protein [Streptomyces chartreusis]
MTARKLVTVHSSLRVGPSGRAMAAHLPASLTELILAQDLPDSADPGVLNEHEFRAALEDIRASGYSLGIDEFAGWAAVAAPVLWGNTIYGALSVLKPTSLLTDVAAVAAHTKAAAGRLSLLVAGGRPKASSSPRLR